jgi:hypothetical protein
MDWLRSLTEEECYLRCYGWVGTDEVRVIRPDDVLSPEVTALITDRIRREFEARLDEREADAA